MTHRRIVFPSLPWQAGGDPLERKKGDPSAPVILLEFAPGFADPNWCERGHSGYVFKGALRMEYEAGTDEDYGAGEGFHIEAGTRHRASNPGSTPVRLFIVSTPA